MTEHFIVREVRETRERWQNMRHGDEPDSMTAFLLLERAGLLDPDPEEDDPST